MKEEFLYYVWRFKLWGNTELQTVSGDSVEVIDSGTLNKDAGPDFFNSRVRIGSQIWAGNVEIHVTSSDWLRHNHQEDRAYDNVILHVVYEYDRAILDVKGQEIPALMLKEHIDNDLVIRYNRLVNSRTWIPCENQIKEVDKIVLATWLSRLSVERLERKSREIKGTLVNNKNDFESTFYQYLFKYFGLSINGLPFELLAKNTPLKVIEKHRDKLLSIEALLFGQSGFLEESINNDYHEQLRKEYQFLKLKFNLVPMEKKIWKFFRLRPLNFPTIRISQIANLIYTNSRLFSSAMEGTSVSDYENLFNVAASDYWSTHYQFSDKTSKDIEKRIGLVMINNLVINVIVPVMFTYGKEKSDQLLMDRAVEILLSIKTENNSIINQWGKIGIKAENAMESQSLVELKKNYCSQKNCLNCSIGNHILRQ